MNILKNTKNKSVWADIKGFKGVQYRKYLEAEENVSLVDSVAMGVVVNGELKLGLFEYVLRANTFMSFLKINDVHVTFAGMSQAEIEWAVFESGIYEALLTQMETDGKYAYYMSLVEACKQTIKENKVTALDNMANKISQAVDEIKTKVASIDLGNFDMDELSGIVNRLSALNFSGAKSKEDIEQAAMKSFKTTGIE